MNIVDTILWVLLISGWFVLIAFETSPATSRQNTGHISECLSFEGFQYVSGDCIPIK
jgi:hypothetical protein